MPALRRRCTALVPFALCGVLTACHAWQPEPLSPGQSSQWNQPVRVIREFSEGGTFAVAVGSVLLTAALALAGFVVASSMAWNGT